MQEFTLESSVIEPSKKENLGVYISTYGCQMNENDSERMYSLLEMANYVPVSSPDQASLIIINACSVREKPVHKVYSEVGRYRKLKERNPQLKIGVGGCVGQQEKGNLTKTQPLIDFVFGTDSIDQLPEIVERTLGTKEKVIQAKFEHRAPYNIENLVRSPGVSTFVNIMKGCDNFCTFCVVPYTRGREKSRPLQDVLKDLQALVARGVKEVTLLGQNVNSYKSECGADFAKLLEVLATESGLQRLRFTTSHPKDFNRDLAKVLYRHQNVICEYIHLPIQSGNTEVLARMNRGYTREEYLEKVKMLREEIPNVVFSTDIIVGFPGETEEQFQDTMSMVELVGYETIYAFKYSPRPFTKAARFEDQVSDEVASERLNRLFAHHEKLALEWVKKYEGQELPVLIEKVDGERKNLSGRTTQNKNVFFTLPADMDFASVSQSLIGKTLPVRITKAFPAILRGELVGTH